MGVCLSAEEKAAKEQSNIIDRQLEEDNKKFKKECKILLLGKLLQEHIEIAAEWIGSGESGKSTIVKQMKIIHQNGYSHDELEMYRITIYKNLIDSAQAVVLALRKFRMEPMEPINRVYADKIMDYRIDADAGFVLSADIVRSIESLWHDSIIPSVLDRSSEFYLMDSAT